MRTDNFKGEEKKVNVYMQMANLPQNLLFGRSALLTALLSILKRGFVGIQLVEMDGRPAFINNEGINLRYGETGC